MTTILNAPLRSVNSRKLEELKTAYPEAVVRIEVTEPSEASQMDEQQFWQIIGLLDWGRKHSKDIVTPAIAALSLHAASDIFQFEDILAQKLYALDKEEYAVQFGWDDPARNFSVDGFLYARCAVVANGKSFYEKVLMNTVPTPPEYSFEPLLYIAEKAYHLKTGTNDYDYISATSYETFSNHSGWPDMPPLEDIIKGEIK